ncbi:MAG: MmcQ/YjbR family DNA-binding protein [Thermoanaerobaculia bacterium]
MTETEFRKLALSLPEAEEKSHMGHPDFRVGGKIFATLGHQKGLAVVMFTPDLQETFMHAAPDVFAPVGGGWGRGGATTIELKRCGKTVARDALIAAWGRRAPKRLLAAFDAG